MDVHFAVYFQNPKPPSRPCAQNGWINSEMAGGDRRGAYVRYEDMQSDPVSTFGLAFGFMGMELRQDKLEQAISYSRFENLSAQEASDGFRERPPKTERFFRKGKVGDWRNSLSMAQAERVIEAHEDAMRRFGYLDADNRPVF
jgi:hypothetical protein